MKVFEVTTEYCKGDSKEIETMVQYVTSQSDTLKSVVDYFTAHCEQYGEDLKGVREVLVLVQHIKTSQAIAADEIDSCVPSDCE